MDGNLRGMMTGEVPAPAQVPKVQSLPHRQASHQRARGVAGVAGTTTTTATIGKDGKAGEAADITRKRKIVAGAEVSEAECVCFVRVQLQKR